MQFETGVKEVMEFSRLRPELASALQFFFNSFKLSSDSRFFHPHPLTAEEALRICSIQSKDFYCVAIWQRSVVAYGMLRGWEEGFKIPSLGIAVSPNMRGIGLGSAMIAYLHVTARLMGAQSVRLSVDPENPAVNLYSKLGYQFTEKKPSVWIGFHHLNRMR